MADYESYPLWRRDADQVSNLDPGLLPISPELAAALMSWADEYDRTLDRDDPVASGFAEPAAEVAFAARGETLARRLVSELGHAVSYFDLRVGRDITVDK
ncbi:hypothetical protein Aab01nite_67810 [Paractinoplanes abujensis]|nr:hypothetical protein [Actinoplanes abujensis]GID23191.1 hypothetical protein Aab01nite_67810 [Actinoplanes abujensis]